MGKTEASTEKGEAASSIVDNELPREFLEHLTLRGLRLDLIESGRVVFSMNIPSRLLVCILHYYSISSVLFFKPILTN